MDLFAMEKYIKERGKFDMPEFQVQFSLTYSEAADALNMFEKKGVVKFCEGLTYEVITRNDLDEDASGVRGCGDSDDDIRKQYFEERNRSILERMNLLRDEDDEDEDDDDEYDDDEEYDYDNEEDEEDEEKIFYRKALWECVKIRYASTVIIQRSCSVSYNMAARALEWMERNGYIKGLPSHEVNMSVTEYQKKFGNPEKQTVSDDEERRKCIEERRRALMERMHNIDDSDKESESDGNADVKSNHVSLKTILVECFARGLQEKSTGESYIFDLDGESKFELKFVCEGNSLRISDGGKTLAETKRTKTNVKNVLKDFALVTLEDDEIAITIDKPLGALKALLTLYSAVAVVKKIK